jgi:hypothetical protein
MIAQTLVFKSEPKDQPMHTEIANPSVVERDISSSIKIARFTVTNRAPLPLI